MKNLKKYQDSLVLIGTSLSNLYLELPQKFLQLGYNDETKYCFVTLLMLYNLCLWLLFLKSTGKSKREKRLIFNKERPFLGQQSFLKKSCIRLRNKHC